MKLSFALLYSLLILVGTYNTAYAEAQHLDPKVKQLQEKVSKHVDTKNQLLEEIKEQISKPSGDYRDTLQTMYRDVAGENPFFPIKPAQKFATGKKREIYCKAKGIVYIRAQHNDGTVSEVKLVESSPNMKDSNLFSHIGGGSWKYELKTGYRSPCVSQCKGNYTKENELVIYDARTSNNDNGVFKFKNGTLHSLGPNNGEVLEPLPMFLAMDFLLWGNRDIGHEISFEPGAKATASTFETGTGQRINLISQRTVTRHLPEFSFVDAEGKQHKHQDCYQVDYEIDLDNELSN